MLLSNFLPLVARAVTTTNYTQAYSVAPTGNWDGNDGGWSTFAIRVGTPSQFFRVLPSTSGADTWIPLADHCSTNPAGCGAARGVEPFNAAPNSSPSSGVPTGVNGTAVDAGIGCTINRSPQCTDCTSVNGACTNGPCPGRQCCGDPKGACQSPCKGVGGICTDQYIGCPCTGPDWNAGSSANTEAAVNARLADGFLSSSSSSWTATGTQQIPISHSLGVNGTAQYGTDTLGLGLDPNSGLTLQSNPVAGVAADPFYLGTLGLKATEKNTSLLSQLFSRNMIPSLSYGYTAGAFYQSPPILGSLTLGGFDAARTNRANSNNMTSNLRANDSSIMVSIGGISIANALNQKSSFNAVMNNVTALIDTSLPYLYLPPNLCSIFEKAYGIQWNATAQTYMVNASTHQQLSNEGPSITFTLNTTEPNPASVNITLPYQSFDLGAGYPIFTTGTLYFPLRRANSSNQIILGRAFMQEAYLFVDYEKSQFTISQANFPSNSNVTNIITVDHSPNAIPGATPSPPETNSSGLGKGAIAGIALGTSAALGLLGALAFFIWRSKHPRHVDELSRTQGSPSGITSGSSDQEPEKDGWTSYSPPPAFQSFRTERERMQQQQRAWSPSQEKDPGHGVDTKGAEYVTTGTLGHGSKASSPTSTTDRPSNGRAVHNVNPWENSELEDPRSPAGATSTTLGAGTNSSMGMFSIMDEKPLPLTPMQMQELPGSAAAKEICASKVWDYEREGTPSSQGRSNNSSRSGWYAQGQNLRNDIVSPIDRTASGAGSGHSGGGVSRTGTNLTALSENMRQNSKSSLGSSSVASRPRQKHIFELQADEPGRRSRRESERKRSAATSPTSPRSDK